MNDLKLILICLAALVATREGATEVQACPFCSATQQTISEEIASAEICVIAKLVQPARGSDDPAHFDLAGADTGLARFAVQTVLRGEQEAAEIEEIEVVYFGKDEQDKSFLINALTVDSRVPDENSIPRVDWTTPLPLSSRGVHYVLQLADLPKKGADRLEFFQQYLEDKDPLLAQDAYDEFAVAPYSEVIALAGRLDRQRILQWIEDPQIGPTRRRLYLTLLGACGTASDAQRLESQLLYDYQLLQPGIAAMAATMGCTSPVVGVSVIDELIRADVRRKRQCLDALIAAYLKLKGPAGLPLIENKFLKNSNVEYSHTYAALMALRFLGEETEVIPRERLLASMRLVLDNSQFADQVVADLSRWKDWSVLNRLVSMFKAGEKDDWIRQPVVSYLLMASEQPGQVGKSADLALTELDQIDPDCVKRARRNAAFSLFASAVTRSDKGQSAPTAKPTEPTTDAEPTERSGPAQSDPAQSGPIGDDPAQPDQTQPDPAKNEKESPGRLILIGVPLIAGLLLMGIFALLLRGADVRSGGPDT